MLIINTQKRMRIYSNKKFRWSSLSVCDTLLLTDVLKTFEITVLKFLSLPSSLSFCTRISFTNMLRRDRIRIRIFIKCSYATNGRERNKMQNMSWNLLIHKTNNHYILCIEIQAICRDEQGCKNYLEMVFNGERINVTLTKNL